MIGRVYLQTAEPDPRDVLGLGRSRRLERPRLVMVLARGGVFIRGPGRNVLVQPVAWRAHGMLVPGPGRYMDASRRYVAARLMPVGDPYVRPFRGLRRT